MPDRIRLSSARIKAFTKGFSVPLSLILPIVTLYILDPISFEFAWKGRFPYLFFLWLFFLELALARRKLPNNVPFLKGTRFSLKSEVIHIAIRKTLKLNLLGIVAAILAFICLILPWWTISVSTSDFGLTQSGTFQLYLYKAETSAAATSLDISMDLCYGQAALALMMISGVSMIAGSLKPGKTGKILLAIAGILAIISMEVFLADLQKEVLKGPLGMEKIFSKGSYSTELIGTTVSISFSSYLFLGFWIALIATILAFVATLTKTLIAAFTMAVPTAHVVGTYVFGLRSEVIGIGSLLGLPPFGYGEWALTDHWPLSVEYLVLFAFFTISVLLMNGIEGLKRFSISLFFLGATGSFYMIDTFYPYGTLTALQRLVPLSASSTATVLNWMGYETRLFHYGVTRYLDHRAIEEVYTILWIGGEKPKLYFAINWPCAGVSSLFIYTFMILLFLKNAPFSLQRKTTQAAIPNRLKLAARSKRMSFLLERKTIQAAVMAAETFMVEALRRVPVIMVFVVGAVGTFIVNVLRIVSICIIGVKAGLEAAQMFHSYYGELYFITWIMLYFLAIVFGGRILAKLSTIAIKLKN